ncbi:YegJ family protein [Microbulbifer echini]|uniref:YegJ family protein n=1 Tax=Microbulbifer echini TaxID=1529067 RepID=A0ABV4NSX0_9GAMM
MIRILFYVLLLIPALVNANEKIDDQVVFISEQDKAMNTAIDKARATLNDFFKVADQPPEEASDFKLKVMVSDENGVEHLWFSPFKVIEGGFAGVLVNEPNIIASMSYGKVYAFRESQITDWGYVLNGKQVGSYTVCALFQTMDKSVVEQYRTEHGFECDS